MTVVLTKADLKETCHVLFCGRRYVLDLQSTLGCCGATPPLTLCYWDRESGRQKHVDRHTGELCPFARGWLFCLLLFFFSLSLSSFVFFLPLPVNFIDCNVNCSSVFSFFCLLLLVFMPASACCHQLACLLSQICHSLYFTTNFTLSHLPSSSLHFRFYIYAYQQV